MSKNYTTKKLIAILLCAVMFLSVGAASGTTVSADSDKLDYYATVDDTLGPKTSGLSNDFKLENLTKGGIKMSMTRFGVVHPYVYSRNFGAFPGEGFMLEFSDYLNESSHTTYYGYGTLLLTLSPNVLDDKYKKFNKGMAGILLDTVTGEISLVESIRDAEILRDDPNEKGDPKREDQLVVKQKILQSDSLKAGALMKKTFRFYFTAAGDDINLSVHIDDKVVSGIIEGEILKAIPNHPTTSTYISISSIDYNYYEWNDWSVKFHGHKILDGNAHKNSDGSNTYENGVIPVSDTNIRWVGRWTNNGESAKAYFQSGLELKISGSILKVETDKPIIVSVDGGEWKSYNAGTPTIFTASKSGEHKIKIMSPYQNTNPTISGFYGDASITTLPADKNKTVLFIGDTATAGYSSADKKFAKSIANNFALQTAKRLDYAVSIVATADAAIAAGDAMPSRYFKLGEQGSDKQNANYEIEGEPDCIVVYLGSNDTNGDKVQTAYQGFIEALRASYPDSAIVCMTPISSKNLDLIKKSIGAVQKDGDKNVYFLDTSDWGVELGSDGVNPTQAGHKTMATKLASALKSVMSGKVTISVPTQNNTQNNTQSKKPSTNKEEEASDVTEEESVEIEYVDVEEEQQSGIMDYLWLLVVGGAAAVLALLVVIFWPNLKKLFAKKNS